GAVLVMAQPGLHPPAYSGDLADGIYSAFVSFNPNMPSSIQNAAEWLADTYVGELLNGRIITDFDERTHRFSHATFSLDQVMRGDVPQDAAEILERCAPSQPVFLQFNQRIQTVNGEGNIVAYEGAAAAGSGGIAAAGQSAVATGQSAAAAGQSAAA